VYGDRAVGVCDVRQPSLRIIVCDDAGHTDAAAGAKAARVDLRKERLYFVAGRNSTRRRARAAHGGTADDQCNDDQKPVTAVCARTSR
jgi:hypothetical protein